MQCYLIVFCHSPNPRNKKIAGFLCLTDSLTTDGGLQHPFVLWCLHLCSLYQPISRLFAAAPVCNPKIVIALLWSSVWEKRLTRWLLAKSWTKRKSSNLYFWFQSFVLKKHKWKYPSVKLPPVIRPLISSAIFFFYFERKSSSITDFSHIIS